MKTLSNAELQEAIARAVMLSQDAAGKAQSILLVHLENLTDEQRRRATDELTLEPMESTLDRVDFDARVRAQDGPEWIEHDCDNDMPVSRDTVVEVQLGHGERHMAKAHNFHWDDIGELESITRYRILEQSK